jgi:SecD/SecF fusion protein
MQNIKGFIRLFAILMALSCIFYLSFTFVTRNWEKKAEKYAKDYVAQQFIQDSVTALANGNDIEKSKLIENMIEARKKFFLNDSLAGKKIYLFGLYSYQDCKDKELNLGLDLKGGMNVTMEVSTPDIVLALANFSNDVPFRNAVSEARKKQAEGSTEDFVSLFGKAYQAANPNGRLATIFAAQLKNAKINYESTNDQVLTAISTEADDAVDRAKLVIESRINQFGVAQPNVQHLKSTNRILVELPGVKDEERVRRLLQSSANLEFWETYDANELNQALNTANEKLKIILGYKKDTILPDSTLLKGDYSKAKTRKDTLAADSLALASFNKDVKFKDSLQLAVDSIARKNGKTERQPIGEFAIPTNQTGDGPVLFGTLVKDTATLGKYLRIPEIAALFPRDIHFAWSAKPLSDEGAPILNLFALKTGRDGRPAMMGDVVVDSRKEFDQAVSASPRVTMSMNADGSKKWARLTKANIGKSIAIVLDNTVYSAPNVQQEITGGSSSISGNFTNQEADDLVKLLNTGKLPAPANIVEQTVVGPTLGQEAIRAGILSFVIALIVVLLYMAFYYNKAGLVADVALFVNVFFIIGILSSLGAVLTLPGIAGIILTIALSVDANILIFERIREELREGKGSASAIADGYKHAMSSILDSNLTTLILGIILYAFGSGPVQGFATTLIIGIISSLFCAIFITRLIFDWMLKKEQKIPFSIAQTEHLLRNTKIDFVGNRMKYYMFSGAVIVLGTIFYFQKGFTLGVDFSGGRSYTVRFTGAIDREKVREALAVEFGGISPEVKTAGGDQQLKITTGYLANEVSSKSDSIVLAKLNAGITKIAGANTKSEVMSSIKIGPSIANEVVGKSFLVVIISCVLMFLYILFRFRKWQYGLGAVAALIHDVLVVFSCYTIFDGLLPFPLEIDQHFVAAILTVMGYSMTDTVVVFDRIREFLTQQGKDLASMEKKTTINYALNSTLSRTINTSMITFFVLLVIFIFGGDTIKGFSFALLIGIVIGTYSSLCIATPIVVDFDRRNKEGNA